MYQPSASEKILLGIKCMRAVESILVGLDDLNIVKRDDLAVLLSTITDQIEDGFDKMQSQQQKERINVQ